MSAGTTNAASGGGSGARIIFCDSVGMEEQFTEPAKVVFINYCTALAGGEQSWFAALYPGMTLENFTLSADGMTLTANSLFGGWVYVTAFA